MPQVRVVLVGAGGYGGVGLIELLMRHPETELMALLDVEAVGMPISDLYPHLRGFCDMPITHVDERDPSQADVVFMATPDRVGMGLAPDFISAGARVVDYSGDFRFQTEELYAEYAVRIGKPLIHDCPHLLKLSEYGLTELHRESIRQASIVGNPGCFAVSCILGLAPAVQSALVELDSLICDAKTGVSGAGKKPNPSFHFPARYDNMNAYKIAGHQHVMEIERKLSLLADQDVFVTFTPQVVPLCRGIMSTLYARLKAGVGLDEVRDCYATFYSDEPFVRLLPPGQTGSNNDVRGTNLCTLSVHVDQRTSRLIVVSHIDNLVKGQAGSALQNMNALFGLPESMGLLFPGRYP